MQRLPNVAPAWVRSFIGIKFKDRGRDQDGSDCWGLFRLVYAQRFGLALPSYDAEYDHVFDAGGVQDVRTNELDQSGRWEQLGEAAASVFERPSPRNHGGGPGAGPPP